MIKRLDKTEDGKIMCQLCFAFFPLEHLHLLPNGKREDVCKWCAEEEKQYRETT